MSVLCLLNASAGWCLGRCCRRSDSIGPPPPNGIVVVPRRIEFSQILFGHRLLVTLLDDPGFYHEKILGYETTPGGMITTAGGHAYATDSLHWQSVS